ncbi:peptidylprolyl isomerase [Solirubrum puertoriconensis]|uniref:Peptidylprolyl isomerase n=1 Tax=Solirubrum puertoriconensis TaxID=1751427 RepID=A0A9X0L3K5_SOLP1|nr:peptidylprolyl isomerase [Solirubrum puertoriconensis]KUG06562.1 peptidylprolyl isomerase [Solirubrum puertoriconensis]
MRNNRILLSGAALAAAFLASCQSTKPTASTKQPVLMTLGNQEVPASEFAYVYRKNNSSAPDAGSRENVQEYLDLYTNFKLKVLEAEQRGLDTTQAFKRELDGYKQQLAQPYLTEKSVTDQLVREAYEHMQKEVNASHILVRITPEADPKDTLAAYQRITALRQRVTGGEDFEKVAREASEDPSARENGGRLGYFTALQMVYPFEAAAYKTPVGQVSQPVRTRFGYHVIKVNDMRPAQGEIKVAHLMIRATPGMPKADSVTAKKKVDELYSRLRKGENWEKLVAQFSEDAGSASGGGELPPFGTGRMIPSFEEAAFRLQKSGDLSAPVQTPYGWHIIRLIEKQSVPSFEQMEASLKQKVARDSRSELNRTAFLKRIRTENRFTEVPAMRDALLAQADTSVTKGTLKADAFMNRVAASQPAKGKKSTALMPTAPLFTIGAKPYTIKDLLTFAEQRQQPRAGATPQHAMQLLYDQYVDQSLQDYERANLETKYEDYRMLVKEYRDGILLFQLMDEKVWSKAIEDTVGLKQYFAANQAKYQWEPRVQATLISAATPQLRSQAVTYFSKPTGKGIAEASMPTDQGIPATVAFNAKSATLTAAGMSALESLANQMLADTTLSITATAYAKTNAAIPLAAQRATQVRTFLTSKGVPAKRVLAGQQLGGKEASTAAAVNGVFLRGSTRNPAIIEQRLNRSNPLAVQIQQRAFPKGDSKVVDGVPQQPGTYNVQQDGRYYAVIIDKVLPAGPKSLNEARGQATSDYQNYLEQEWIKELRTKYPVKVNEAEVNKLVTK